MTESLRTFRRKTVCKVFVKRRNGAAPSLKTSRTACHESLPLTKHEKKTTRKLSPIGARNPIENKTTITRTSPTCARSHLALPLPTQDLHSKGRLISTAWFIRIINGSIRHITVAVFQWCSRTGTRCHLTCIHRLIRTTIIRTCTTRRPVIILHATTSVIIRRCQVQVQTRHI